MYGFEQENNESLSLKMQHLQNSYNEETRMLKTENQRLRNEVEFRAENERYLQEQLDDIS